MTSEIVPLDFQGQGALLEPVDRNLHDSLVEFMRRELTDWERINLTRFSKVWVGRSGGEVKGVAGYVLRPDVPLLRATDADVLRALAWRMNGFFSDNGARGQEAFVYVGNEKPEQRCPAWREVLREFGAESARRVRIEVR